MSSSLKISWMLMMLGIALAVPELKQVHVVTRHGARTPLPKDGDTLLDLTGSTLTPTGQKQLYDVGTWLRETYDTDGFLEYYDASEVRLESSQLDRTLTSASALTLGLFPYSAQAGNHGTTLYASLLPEMPGLPVYSHPEVHDIYLRSYHRKCPKFHRKLEYLYQSPRWMTLELKNKALLTKLASFFPDLVASQASDNEIQDGRVVMKHMWTYYDRIKVVRTECDPDPAAYACVSLGDDATSLINVLSAAEFLELEKLVGLSEEMKFGIATAGNLLGSPLLWRMLRRVLDAPDGKFFLYSGHAPTLLGLLSTLQWWEIDEDHPDYGSAIIMEVYQDSSNQEYSVRFLYKAARKTTALYIPMERADCEQVHNYNGQTATGAQTTTTGMEISHCGMAAFVAWAAQNTLVNLDDWCQACENDTADVCMQTQLQENKVKRDFESSETASDDDDQRPLVIAGTFFGGLFAGILLMGVGFSLFRRGGRPSEQEDIVDPQKAGTSDGQAMEQTAGEIEAPREIN